MLAGKNDKKWAVVVGTGVALSPLHNLWLTKLATLESGEVIFFLPQFGYLLLIMGSGLFLLNNWDRVRKVGWGEKKLVIPMLALVLVIGLSGITAGGVTAKIAPLGMGLSMFALYVSSRFFTQAGVQKWLVLPTLVVGGVACVIGIIVGIVAPGQRDAGLFTNYCALVGFEIYAGLLLDRRWLWFVSGFVVLAVVLTGALEGLVILGALAIAIIVRRDWGKRLLAPVGITIVCVGIWGTLGMFSTTYQHTIPNINALRSLITGNVLDYSTSESAIDAALTGRWVVIRDAILDIKWLGHGYELTPAPYEGGSRRPVHNMPLLAVDQVGPLGGALWLYVTILCLIRTKWKYIWIAVLASSVFDYYIWTQLVPYWWMFIALSTTDKTGNDMIFKIGEQTT